MAHVAVQWADAAQVHDACTSMIFKIKMTPEFRWFMTAEQINENNEIRARETMEDPTLWCERLHPSNPLEVYKKRLMQPMTLG